MRMKIKKENIFIKSRIGKAPDCSTFQLRLRLRVRWDIQTNKNENNEQCCILHDEIFMGQSKSLPHPRLIDVFIEGWKEK